MCADCSPASSSPVSCRAATPSPVERAATTEPPGAELALPDGVHIGVEFPRYLMVERRLEAIIDNQSDVDVTVIDVALRSPLFEPVEPDVHDYRVAAGLRQDLQMAVGPSICPRPTSRRASR